MMITAIIPAKTPVVTPTITRVLLLLLLLLSLLSNNVIDTHVQHYSKKVHIIIQCTKRFTQAYSYEKQVDILISKNQALQILCLKHHVYKTS